MLWFSDMLGVYVPCTYVLNGTSDIMPDNGHISYILWMSASPLGYHLVVVERLVCL